MLLAGFGYCAGTQGGICDARIAAGVSIFGCSILYGLIKHTLYFAQIIDYLIVQFSNYFQVFAIFNTVAYGLGSFILWNDYKSTPPELQ